MTHSRQITWLEPASRVWSRPGLADRTPPGGWRRTERFLERAGECGLGVVADNLGNLGEGRAGVAELLSRDHRIALGTGATEKPADHPRASAAATMMNREQFAILGRLDNVAARHRRQAQIAAHQMRVIARQQNDFAGPNDEVLAALTLDSDMKVTLDDVVIKNQVGRWPESRRAMLGRDARR